MALAIVIVGAGLGGLAAAVSFRRQGHRVEIFESSLMNQEIGAAITIQANASRVLEYFGYNKDNLKGVEFLGLFCHRTDLHDELKRLAIGEQGSGPPALLHLGQEVASCDPVKGILTLKNGETHEADLVIGADGIHSVIRTSVLGYPQTALSSGTSCFRFMLDATKLEGHPDMEWLREGMSGPCIVMSPEEHFQMLFLSSCRHGGLINAVALHADDRDQDTHEFKDFHPRYLEFLELAEQPILKWQLRVLPLLPTWINGRTALLGDAAHVTLPTLGQGAGMALEDAAAIGCLIPLGTTKDDIAARLQAYQELRKSRGDFLNALIDPRVGRQRKPSGLS
ncbi:hypothetical protein C8R44DRAFT_831231 [Mycena epipterygia]|nr:hypothetical protein C8R44DRAFT_831231 [Mycena epipterygia]